jgi:hypothetical protein
MTKLYTFNSLPAKMPFQQLQQYRNVTSYLSRPYPGLHANEWTCSKDDHCGTGSDAFKCFPTPDRNFGAKRPSMPGYGTQICSMPPTC